LLSTFFSVFFFHLSLRAISVGSDYSSPPVLSQFSLWWCFLQVSETPAHILKIWPHLPMVLVWIVFLPKFMSTCKLRMWTYLEIGSWQM
jgi:hypothetical protein